VLGKPTQARRLMARVEKLEQKKNYLKTGSKAEKTNKSIKANKNGALNNMPFLMHWNFFVISLWLS